MINKIKTLKELFIYLAKNKPKQLILYTCLFLMTIVILIAALSLSGLKISIPLIGGDITVEDKLPEEIKQFETEKYNGKLQQYKK